MSHFAKIDSTRTVVNVITAEQAFIDTLPDADSWIQTSYRGRIRGKYAGIGDKHDKDKDVFVGPLRCTAPTTF